MQYNLADLFEGMADRFPERRAVQSDLGVTTYGELDERATRLANAWKAHGIGAGDHVGLFLYNRVEYLECMLAAFKLRAVTINVNYRYVAEELRYIFDNAELKGLIYEEDLRAVVDEAGTEDLSFVVAIGPEYDALMAEGSPVRDFPERSEDDQMIIYTGGTTGMPRGVMWRHEDLFYAALQGGNPGGEPAPDAQAHVELVHRNGDGTSVLGAAPLIHGGAQLASWISLMSGGCAGLVTGRGFDPVKVLDVAEAGGMNAINMIGDAMVLPFTDCLAANPGRWALKELNAISSAGAVMSTSVWQRLSDLLPHAEVLNNFGASETGHQGTGFLEDGEVTWIMDDRHTTVVNAETLERIEPGSGEVGMLARFGHVPVGYYGDAEKTARTFFMKDGVRYVLPGDLATIDEDEMVVFLGRGAACINTGGEKVYAEEVEQAIKADPRVFDALVVGVPDERWGQRVEAIITLRPGAEPDADAVEATVRGLVAGYKTPKRFWFVPTLNRQPSGKPDYRWAREEAIRRGEAESEADTDELNVAGLNTSGES